MKFCHPQVKFDIFGLKWDLLFCIQSELHLVVASKSRGVPIKAPFREEGSWFQILSAMTAMFTVLVETGSPSH